MAFESKKQGVVDYSLKIWQFIMQTRVTGRTGNLEWETEIEEGGVYFYSIRFGTGRREFISCNSWTMKKEYGLQRNSSSYADSCLIFHNEIVQR